jgi:hypothetical protein
MSTVRFLGLKCDGCSEALRHAKTADAIFAEYTCDLHRMGRLRGWNCGKWAGVRQVDSCPKCVKKFAWTEPG